ncbi:plasmid mobilization relaxosome protein MobC [Streptomyces boluensis]|uniref:plasmid mobilization relaxosome protein MobC n=1 Tax=Streptomyces boluensis TaxID=1775135 RepID=UPI0028AB5B86|nr:plasmid mobilization relaxosome protein MobC [Streptomyces boluensis]
MAEARGRQGAPTSEKPTVDTELPLPRAADEAAFHRVARRRTRDSVQRKQRVDARYSTTEKTKILSKARSLNISGAHLVATAVMAYIDGDLALPGQRTELDDYIDELNALREQVARVGRNVNQIAKKLNSDGTAHPTDIALLALADRTLEHTTSAVQTIAAAANQAVSTARKATAR